MSRRLRARLPAGTPSATRHASLAAMWVGALGIMGASLLASPAQAQPADEEALAEPATEVVGLGDDGVGDGDGDGDGAAPEEICDDRPSTALRYVLEGVAIEGNDRTSSGVIQSFVPLEIGEPFDPEESELESLQFALMGTGFFDDVQLRLRRGASRGGVILVVRVRERNTLVVQQIALGVAEGLNAVRASDGRVFPYVGLSVAETNLFGRGMRLSLSALVSRHHQGVRIEYGAPRFLGTAYSLRVWPFFNNSREYFGRNPLVSTRCGDSAPTDCLEEINARNAVVFYRRGGFGFGTGRAIGSTLHVELGIQLEWIHVTSRPEAASELRGTEIRPIDFSIQPGRSFASVLTLGLTYDRRDDPALPTRGTVLTVNADAGTRLVGSVYDFIRLQARFQQWIPLAPRHTLRLGLFGGVVLGDAPFFYRFHASDLSDLIPSRVLEMELDRRPPPNLLGTSIIHMRQEEVAMRADIEYSVSLLRRPRRGLRGLRAYALVGTYMLADLLDLQFAIPGYEGASRIPIDLTFDIGFRFDTPVGVFQLGFSNLLGFIDL